MIFWSVSGTRTTSYIIYFFIKKVYFTHLLTLTQWVIFIIWLLKISNKLLLMQNTMEWYHCDAQMFCFIFCYVSLRIFSRGCRWLIDSFGYKLRNNLSSTFIKVLKLMISVLSLFLLSSSAGFSLLFILLFY